MWSEKKQTLMRKKYEKRHQQGNIFCRPYTALCQTKLDNNELNNNLFRSYFLESLSTKANKAFIDLPDM